MALFGELFFGVSFYTLSFRNLTSVRFLDPILTSGANNPENEVETWNLIQ